MDRREFLVASLGVSAVLSNRKAFAQTTSTRAAVVIGVDQAGTLPRLQAVDGANAIADWLKDEGFEVKRFVDTTQKVRQTDIYDGIAEFVGRGTIEMLVLYFAGHGFMSAAHGLTVLTANERHFEPLGVPLANPLKQLPTIQ